MCCRCSEHTVKHVMHKIIHFHSDGSGRVMQHPLLPHPIDLMQQDGDPEPVFVSIDTLEMVSDVHTIIDSMQS